VAEEVWLHSSLLSNLAHSVVEHGDGLDATNFSGEAAEGRTGATEAANCSVPTKVTGIAI
jgi:hypothetical protein